MGVEHLNKITINFMLPLCTTMTCIYTQQSVTGYPIHYNIIICLNVHAKAYSRAHGRPIEWKDRDRFAVDADIDEGTAMLIGPVSTSILLMCAFILVNLLVMIKALLFFDDTFLWLQSGDKLRAFYIASGIVLAIVNVITSFCLRGQTAKPVHLEPYDLHVLCGCEAASDGASVHSRNYYFSQKHFLLDAQLILCE